MSHDEAELVHVVPAAGWRSGQTGAAPRPVPARVGHQLVRTKIRWMVWIHGVDTVPGVNSQVDQLLRDRFRPIEAKRTARTGEPGMGADDGLLECGRHTPGQLVRPS